MKFFRQLCIILAVSFIGEILHFIIPLPVPAGIYGIILLFIGLETKLIPKSSVKETSDLLIDIMPVMLVPAAVELMDSWGVIKPNLLKFAAATVISTFAVMAVSGAVTQAVIRLKAKKVNTK
ncbi:MAG: CidA/LrgA family protein [Oscillospiraceae bacterium]